MKVADIFLQSYPFLEEIPEKPKVFWYPSSGKDFRGNVFLTEAHIQHQLKYHKRFYSRPDLFVFSCLGREVTELKQKLRNGNMVLYQDNCTTVTASNYVTLGIDREIFPYKVNPNYINTELIPKPTLGKEAFYIELEISGVVSNSKYCERQKLFYFEQENFNFFENFVLGQIFDVKYLCATREGMGFGGCKKSMIQHIYQDGAPSFYLDQGFAPEFAILFNDFTSDIFKETAANTNLFTIKEKYDDYIWESRDIHSYLSFNGADAIIYKIDYLKTNS